MDLLPPRGEGADAALTGKGSDALAAPGSVSLASGGANGPGAPPRAEGEDEPVGGSGPKGGGGGPVRDRAIAAFDLSRFLG
jgi:hypothetical protein